MYVVSMYCVQLDTMDYVDLFSSPSYQEAINFASALHKHSNVPHRIGISSYYDTSDKEFVDLHISF